VTACLRLSIIVGQNSLKTSGVLFQGKSAHDDGVAPQEPYQQPHLSHGSDHWVTADRYPREREGSRMENTSRSRRLVIEAIIRL